MHGLDHPNPKTPVDVGVLMSVQSKQLNDNPFSHIQRVFLEYLPTIH